MNRLARSNFARRSEIGFTLIELIVVLLLIAITMALAAPSFRGWSDGSKLRNAGDEFVASARWARSQAILAGTPHVLRIDGASYYVGSVPSDNTTNVTPVAGTFGRATEVPMNFSIAMISGGESGAILFYPNGRCSPAVVRITSAQRKVVDIASEFPADPFRVVSTDGVTR